MKKFKVLMCVLAVVLFATSSFTQKKASKAYFSQAWFIYNGGGELDQENYTKFTGEPTELCDGSDILCAIQATIENVNGVDRPLDTDTDPNTISLEDIETAGGFAAAVPDVSKFMEE